MAPKRRTVRIADEEYVLVPVSEWRSLMREVVMGVRLARLLATNQETALVNALLPVLREGVPALARALAGPRRTKARPLPTGTEP